MARLCPKCGSKRIHRSHRRGFGEHVLSVGGLRARRCHECNTRFVTLGSSTLFRSDIDRLLRRVAIVALGAVAILAVVSTVLWLSRREANAPAETSERILMRQGD